MEICLVIIQHILTGPKLSSYSDKTFAAAEPHLWNCLPVQLRHPDITYGLLRRQLKGHLFQETRTRRSVTSDMRRLRKTQNTYLLTYLLTATHRGANHNRTKLELLFFNPNRTPVGVWRSG